MDLAQVTEVLHQTLQQVEQQIQRYQEMAEQLARRESLCWEAQENLGIFSLTANTRLPLFSAMSNKKRIGKTLMILLGRPITVFTYRQKNGRLLLI